MNLFSYVIVNDRGFAPNPYGGYCTLATCKPIIRRIAKVEDYVIGTGSKHGVGAGKLVYTMVVSESLSIEEYSSDPRFDVKKPTKGESWQKAGDNIYYKNSTGLWQQRPSYHKDKDMEHDLSGINVLIATNFYYFGSNALQLPSQFKSLVKKGPGHIKCTDTFIINKLSKWLHQQSKPGIHGTPFNNRYIARRLINSSKAC